MSLSINPRIYSTYCQQSGDQEGKQTSHSVSGTKWKKRQETGTDPLTNGMFLRGTEDNNLFQLHASVPKDQGKNRGRDDPVSAPREKLLDLGKSRFIARLLSTAGASAMFKPPSIRALSVGHNGSLMVTINSPFC